MRTLLIAASKGGCGKSTIATQLAALQASKGHRVALIDADPQGTSLAWCARRGEDETLSPVTGLEGARQTTFEHIPEDTDMVIIDTPAGIAERMLEPLLARADAVLTPVLPSVFDLDAASAFAARLATAPRIRQHKLAVGLVANRLRPWTHGSQQALEALRKLPFPVAGQIRDTQAYAFLSGLGKSIFDYHSMYVLAHQHDWRRLTNWVGRNT